MPLTMDQSDRSSSVYSTDSTQRKPLPFENRLNGSDSRRSSRAASYTPSYMSNVATRATNGSQPARSSPVATSQTPTRATPEPLKPVPPQPSEALLVISPGRLHPSLLFYLEILLEKHAFSSVIFAASKTQEAEVKQLRMDVFALLGKLRKEVAVSVDTQEAWTSTEIDAVVQSATKGGQRLHGVLCCPELAEDGNSEENILDVDGDQLDKAWRCSVAFLHSVSKATVPHLAPSSGKANGDSSQEARSPFFLVTQPSASSAASQIAKASFSLLMMKLGNITNRKGLVAGYAEATLVPEAKQATFEQQDEPFVQPIQTTSAGDDGFTPPESPTKLWNMWALQNDTPTFD